VFARRTK